MSDPRLSCPICLRREAGLIPAPRHVAKWDELNGPEQMAMLAEVGAALGRGTPGFVASSAYDHFQLREASGSRLTTGGRDPLLPLLAERLDTAQSVDLAIAFAMDSGVALLEPWSSGSHTHRAACHATQRLRPGSQAPPPVTPPSPQQHLEACARVAALQPAR